MSMGTSWALSWLFGLGWGLVIYSYALYPVLLAIVAAAHQIIGDLRFVTGKSERRISRRHDLQVMPAVAVVIAAYNEELHIEHRVRNLLAQDYPAQLLHIYVGSDGSRDRTAAILCGLSSERVHVFNFEVNRGKASVLNDLRERVNEPIVVLSDANTVFDVHAISRLVRWFDDPQVGGVSGELRLMGNAGQNQDSLYWRVEQVLKFLEARIGALLGANGAIYAVRKSLWPALRPDEICDDFCIGMHVSSTGHRMAYDPEAWAEEDTPHDIHEEHHRRLRIGLGNFQALFLHPEFLSQTSWLTRWAYVSHKILRWTTPHLILLAWLACLLLALTSAMQRDVWIGVLAAQTLGMTLSAWFYRRAGRGLRIPRVATLPTFFFALNWAFLIASVRFVTGTRQRTWRRTSR